jgi:hypothetical protein
MDMNLPWPSPGQVEVLQREALAMTGPFGAIAVLGIGAVADLATTLWSKVPTIPHNPWRWTGIPFQDDYTSFPD